MDASTLFITLTRIVEGFLFKIVMNDNVNNHIFDAFWFHKFHADDMQKYWDSYCLALGDVK